MVISMVLHVEVFLSILLIEHEYTLPSSLLRGSPTTKYDQNYIILTSVKQTSYYFIPNTKNIQESNLRIFVLESHHN